MAWKGRFKPKNPSKYKGDPRGIVYRSSWELSFMSRLDLDESVVWWSSEEVVVNYRSPKDGKVHRYFPDFLVTRRMRDGSLVTTMIEIKPKKQTVPPTPPKKAPAAGRNKRYLAEVFTWGINSAKWEAARRLCEARGWRFEVMTEDDLGIKV